MWRLKRCRRLLAINLLLLPTSLLLMGCRDEETKPSAPGYYDGPMKPKGGTTAPTGAGQTKGSDEGAGNP